MRFDAAFWSMLDALVQNSAIIVDRPRGSAHPPFPEAIAVNCQLYADFAMRKRFWYFRRTYCWIFR